MKNEIRQKLILRMIDACGKESVEVKDFTRVCELFPEDEVHDRILTEVVKNYEKKKKQIEGEKEREYTTMVYRKKANEKGRWEVR